MRLRYKKVRPASRYQRRDDPTKLVAEAGETRIRDAIAKALKGFRRGIPVKDVAAKVRQGDPAGAADAVNMQTLRHALIPAYHAIADVRKESALRGAGEVNERRRQARARRVRKDPGTMSGEREVPDRFSFDIYSDEVMQDLQEYQDVFLGEMTDEVRQTIFDAITEGVKDNLDPDDVALRVRDVIGLSDQQATAVENYRNALEEGSRSALGRSLVDDDADEEVEAAIDAGAILDEDRIAQLVDDYIDRSIDYRADTIAMTESNRAASLGLQDSYSQAIQQGVLPDEAVRKFWRISLDERTCDICEGIADDAEDGIPVGDSFQSDDGDIDGTPAHPRCRCSVEMVTNLDLVDVGEDQ